MIKKILSRLLIVIVLLLVIVGANIAFFIKNSKTISVGESIPVYNTTNCALLVIDIQEGTTGQVSRDKHYKDVSEELITYTNRIIKRAQEKGSPIIYVKSEVTNPIINLFDNSLATGTIGANLDKRLKIVSDNIISKEKQDAFSNPALDEILTQKKINKIYVVGLDAAHCVYTTMKAAINREYRVTVIEEALVSESEKIKEEMLNLYAENNIQVINIDNFLN